MPLFVDGVEINEVWVDGVEQDTVFADGVEVFSGANLGDEFDDSFTDSVGTLIENHTLNSGQSWTTLTTSGNSTIQNYLAGTACQRTSGSAATIDIVANPIVGFAPAMHSIMNCGWNRTQATVWANFYFSTPGNSYVRFQYIAGTNTCWIRLYINGVQQPGETIFSATNAVAWTVECWYDSVLGQIQGRVTINAIPITSQVWNVTPNLPLYYQITLTEQAVFTQIASIDTYQLTPFKSGEVPFP